MWGVLVVAMLVITWDITQAVINVMLASKSAGQVAQEFTDNSNGYL